MKQIEPRRQLALVSMVINESNDRSIGKLKPKWATKYAKKAQRKTDKAQDEADHRWAVAIKKKLAVSIWALQCETLKQWS